MEYLEITKGMLDCNYSKVELKRLVTFLGMSEKDFESDWEFVCLGETFDYGGYTTGQSSEVFTVLSEGDYLHRSFCKTSKYKYKRIPKEYSHLVKDSMKLSDIHEALEKIIDSGELSKESLQLAYKALGFSNWEDIGI